MNVQDNECKVLMGFRNLGYFRTWQSSLLCGGNRGLVCVRSKAIKYWVSRGQMTELVGGDGDY